MQHIHLTNFAVFIFISSITPGPNNLMLLHCGVKVGFRACYPHMLGISLGTNIMFALSYWGMATVVTELPAAMFGLKIIGTTYLLWLAWHMWVDGIVPDKKALAQETQVSAHGCRRYFQTWTLPLNIWQAMLFQWANPKAWLMVTVAPSICLMDGEYPLFDNAPLYVLAFIISQCCIAVWAVGGHSLRQLLHHQRLMRVVHILVVFMTVYCAVSLWLT